jgi:hypothetical protein
MLQALASSLSQSRVTVLLLSSRARAISVIFASDPLELGHKKNQLGQMEFVMAAVLNVLFSV